MEFQLIEIVFGSPEYDDTVWLRTEVLRKPLNMEFKAEDLALEYDQYHFGLYDNGNNLRACLILKEVDQNIVKMRQVAVSPALQGKGLGKIMVTKLELWIKHKGYKKIVLSARDTAVAFYLSMDYSIDGGIFEEVGIPHQSMFKIF